MPGMPEICVMSGMTGMPVTSCRLRLVWNDGND